MVSDIITGFAGKLCFLTSQWEYWNKMQIYFNGNFVDEEAARVSIFEPGFLYGQGCFETMRSYGGKIFRLDSHIERLYRSLPLVNIKLDIEARILKAAVQNCLRQNSLKDAYLRLTVWQGQDKVNVAAFAKKYDFLTAGNYRKGFKIITSNFRQNEFSILSQIKCSNYLALLLAYQEARKHNADESLLLNTQSFIAETARANIFLVKDNCLITPSLDCGCLGGITRDTVLGIAQKEKIKAIETKITYEDLKKADEAFLTSSLIEVMPLVSIDGRAVNKGTPGRITEIILKNYRKLTL